MELGVHLQVNHVIRIVSITKQITAGAILLHHDRGELSVNDDTTQYLTDFSTQATRLTIDHLLSHTSGVFNFTDIPDYWRGDQIRPDHAVEQMIDLFADDPLQFPPGGDFSYSNSEYILLGAIIARVSG